MRYKKLKERVQELTKVMNKQYGIRNGYKTISVFDTATGKDEFFGQTSQEVELDILTKLAFIGIVPESIEGV